MLRAKVVLVGLPGVGKTSLVRRFVSDEFTDRHLQTIGVRVEKRVVTLPEADVELLIWDIAGPEPERPMQLGYLNGAAVVMLVADRSAPESTHALQGLAQDCRARLPEAGFFVLINKLDLPQAPGALEALSAGDWDARFDTSALTGEGVAQAFSAAARHVLERRA